MRLVFMGTPEIALPVLKAVSSRHEVVAVYTRPDAYSGRGRELAQSAIKKEASKLGIPVIQPLNFKDGKNISVLQDLQPEVIVVVAYGIILPKAVLEIPRLGCINVHFSVLPRHRGASPVAGAILAGDRFTGVSIMLMETGVDTGPILSISQLPVFDWDTTLSLGQRLSGISGGLIIDVLEAWNRREIILRPQNEAAATYSGIIHKEDGLISWNEEAALIWRKARAYHPWPGIYTTWRGKMLKLLSVEPVSHHSQEKPGSVISFGGTSDMNVGVVTGKGILGIKKIQLEGKKEVLTADFIRGQRDFIGSVLPD
ncbi:MAG: methionyl-tRNA formyltransferase [Dehalococcoidales bacterium]|nr:methionyl-tRNA formyltransferase [Dehalococcoidales bacterium]MDX9986274.1 methionyl-tRNA formyltransferase [Dehalococcoidales bacterium]NLE90848.1 methionyl-tRNA formyltransferase [Dehalococcoidales bacterium]